jgi:hypothetical protein
MKFKTREERLEIVLDIVRKLKNFPTTTGTIIDLYNCDFPAMSQLKIIFNRYINQDDTQTLISESGKIAFPEINRKIQFILPVKKDALPTFILKATRIKDSWS